MLSRPPRPRRPIGPRGTTPHPASAVAPSPAPGAALARSFAALALLAAPLPDTLLAQEHETHHGHAPADSGAAAGWRMPPMPSSMPMIPPLMELEPRVEPWLPGAGVDPSAVPEAVFRRVEALADGDTLSLEAGLVRRTIGNREFLMYGFNGQYPGPLIRVPRGATIVVRFRNAIEMPTTVHWHGVRLDNRFDGVPGVTQEPVEPGGDFTYEVRFPDAGIYWYHPHVREDVQQDLGLYGNILVDPSEETYWSPVNREEVLMLDDLLVDEAGLFPYGRQTPTHALMGRFGNVLLVNGEPDWRLEVDRGEVVRFFLTDVSNTRTFNLSLAAEDGTGVPLKLVGADIGRFEREERVESVVIGPAQRYVVEARFAEPGTVALVNSIQAIDHFEGTFYPRVDTLGLVTVGEEPAAEDHAAAFGTLRENRDVVAEIDRYREQFDRPVDRALDLTVRVSGLPSAIVQIMSLDTLYVPPVEWNDAMPMMNLLSSAEQVTWILRDVDTGKENEAIEWTFREGEVYRIRLHNVRRAFHPMQHPIHLHGQRFLVLSRDGVPNGNLAWKDTVIVPVGSTFDILLEASNPGDWMLHCHIAEHLHAGMSMVFTVEPAS